MTHARRRGMPAPLRANSCTHCGRPYLYCNCKPKHRSDRARTRTVLHPDLISVPSDPPVWRSVLVAVFVAAALVAGWGVVQPADVALVSCVGGVR